MENEDGLSLLQMNESVRGIDLGALNGFLVEEIVLNKRMIKSHEGVPDLFNYYRKREDMLVELTTCLKLFEKQITPLNKIIESYVNNNTV